MTIRGDAPGCYGRSWEADDEDCEACELEFECRDVLRARRQKSQQVPLYNPPYPPTPRTQQVGVMRQRETGGARMPKENEKWYTRLGLNILYGAASQFGEEVADFFKKYDRD